MPEFAQGSARMEPGTLVLVRNGDEQDEELLGSHLRDGEWIVGTADSEGEFGWLPRGWAGCEVVPLVSLSPARAIPGAVDRGAAIGVFVGRRALALRSPPLRDALGLCWEAQTVADIVKAGTAPAVGQELAAMAPGPAEVAAASPEALRETVLRAAVRSLSRALSEVRQVPSPPWPDMGADTLAVVLWAMLRAKARGISRDQALRRAVIGDAGGDLLPPGGSGQAS